LPLETPAHRVDERFEEVFRAAVAKRLMGDVPVGVLFSGGVDSTLNALAFSDLIAPGRVQTYTVGMSGAPGFEDECASARAQARRVGADHHEVRISADDLLEVAVPAASLQDEPLADPVCIPLYFVSKLARDTGTIVLQAGEGADELFCGYDDYRRWMNRHERFWRPVSHLPRAFGRLGSSLLARSRNPLRRKMAEALARHARDQEFFVSSAVGFYENDKRSVLAPDLARRLADLDSYALVEPLYRRIDEQCPDATFLQRMTFIELQHRLPELLLMRVDKMTMAHGVEARVPFLDRDVIDFALSLPDAAKLDHGITKAPLKRLAARSVGRENAYLPKRGFVAPIQGWFRGRLGESLREVLEEDRHELDQFFDRGEVRRRVDGPLDTVNQAFQLWVVFSFIQWRRAFFSEPHPQPSAASAAI
jgi:asparagine synthase (glutamine-hydrolysing)